MQISTSVWKFTLIFLDIYWHVICFSHSVTLTLWPFDYKYCCYTPQVNADQLDYIAVMHGHVTVRHCNVAWSRDCAALQCRRRIHHSIMMNVT